MPTVYSTDHGIVTVSVLGQGDSLFSVGAGSYSREVALFVTKENGDREKWVKPSDVGVRGIDYWWGESGSGHIGRYVPVEVVKYLKRRLEERNVE